LSQVTIYNFDVPEGDWNVDANWDLELVPDQTLADEGAVIGGDRIANVNEAVPQVGQVTIGDATGAGTVNIGAGGQLTVAKFEPTDAATEIIRVLAGEGAGQLNLSGNATLSARIIQLSPTGTLRITGPDVDVLARQNFRLDGGTYIPVLTGPTHSTIRTTGPIAADAFLTGVIRPELDGYVPAVGTTWDLFDVPTVQPFDNVPPNTAGITVDQSGVTGLGPGEKFNFEIINGGVNGRVGRLYLDQMLTLTVDRATGAMSITNASNSAVDIESYQITSALGGLNPGIGGANWTSLQDANGSNWRESPQNGTTNALAELKPTGSTPILAANPISLGDVFEYPTAPSHGVDLEDLVFEYFTSDGRSFTGLIEYTGDKFQNDMLLVVDPTSGDARITNESGFAVDVKGYSITSDMNALDSISWQSLDDQDAAGGDWAETGVDVGTSVGSLTELKTAGATNFAINKGNFFDLGALFNGTAQDLVFEYLLDGETEFRIGAVEYAELAGLDGDYNGDGSVDAADYVVWRKNPGMFGDQQGYDNWVANFGATAGGGAGAVGAVPEPPATGTVIIAASIVVALRFRRALA
jgi:hypothetical protein